MRSRRRSGEILRADLEGDLGGGEIEIGEGDLGRGGMRRGGEEGMRGGAERWG